MSATVVIARQHLRMLSRSHTFLLLLAVLLGMTALSGLIGWSSHSTIIRVYDETVRTLVAAGKPAPPNPFADKPRLSLLNNMIIYVPLIGALLAIVIGHLSVTGDRQAGVTRVIFSRPVRRSSYFWGKVGRSVLVGVVTMTACLALSAIGLTGTTRIVHFDKTKTADHYPVNTYSLYYADKNALIIDVTASSSNVRPATFTVRKDAGGAEAGVE